MNDLAKYVSRGALAVLAAHLLSGCGQTSSNQAVVTSQGTVQLENLKVGQLEDIFKTASLSFAPDSNPMSRTGGKVQYNSKIMNTKGGQYIAQCKDGKCYELQVYYMNAPVSREIALITLQQMLPDDAPPQTKIDESEVKAHKDKPVIRIYFGDHYMGELHYKNKGNDEVEMVNALSLPPPKFDLPSKLSSTTESAHKH